MDKNKSRKKFKLSDISVLHYIKLVYRSVLLVAAIIAYVFSRIQGIGEVFGGFEDNYWLLCFICLVFIVEMILRFFPSRFESMGCQKQFARNYKKISEDQPIVQSQKTTLLIGIGWLAFNMIFGVLYYCGIFDAGILVLIALVFSVCDMICILFFCPFQTWFMKNRCCATCRIYNWDFAMMFTPLVFIPSLYTWSLLGIALALLIQWEILLRLHPERFSEATNQCLACRDCPEKLCHHKKQLQSFLRRNREYLRLKGNAIIRPDKEK